MTAKEYFYIWFNNNSNNPAFVYDHLNGTTGIDIDNVIKLLQEFAHLKCKEQREICAEKAKINIKAKFKGDLRNTACNSYFFVFKDTGGKRDITVSEDSIINTPEPMI